ncbi:hypothetical protein ACW0S4_09145 [Fusobacterium polymorphum]
MDILEKILNNSELAEKIRIKCDIELYPQLQKPDDMDGQITWNIDGKAFGIDGSGGEFILLSDGTIGFNSSEGETGRIAENIKELFSLLVNCPCFNDFLMSDIYKDKILLKKYADKIEKEYREEFSEITDYDWDKLKREIASELDLPVDDNIAENTLVKFYEVATREPQYQSTYHEDDGSLTLSEPLISRPMGDWIRENLK